ncbi:MAG: cytochrome c oxidase subunit 3 [Acidimicrobiales bacterium]
MTDISAYYNAHENPHDIIPEYVDAPEPARPRLLLLATSLVSAAVLVGYGAMVGYYLSVRAPVRASGESWLPADIPLTQPNFMLITIVMSVISAGWTIQAVRNNDKANSYIAFSLTILFGFAQVAQTAYLLTLLETPAGDGEAASLMYLLIGTQIAVMLAAMAFMALTLLRTLGGGYSARDSEGVLSSAIFWFVSAGVYTLLWYVVYISK